MTTLETIIASLLYDCKIFRKIMHVPLIEQEFQNNFTRQNSYTLPRINKLKTKDFSA